jgi:TP901 family phage tail tape measure protein
MTKDVILDLGVQDGGTLKAAAEQIKQLDQSILATIRDVEKLSTKLANLGKGAKSGTARETTEAELKSLNTKLAELLRDQATARRAGKSSADAIYNNLQDPAQKAAVKMQLEAFKKSLDQQLTTQKEVLGQMSQKFQQELIRQRRQIEAEIRNSQKEAAQRGRQSRISQIAGDSKYPEQYLRGLPAYEVKATRAAAAQLLKQSSDLGNKMGMKAASNALETIDKYMSDKAAPGLRRRQEQLAAAVGNKAALNSLIAGSNTEDLKVLIKTARKTASTEAQQFGNSGKAQDYAQLANSLQTALQQMAPAVQQLKAFATQANTAAGRKQLVATLQKEDPAYLKAQQSALNRQARSAFSDGDKKTGNQYAKSAELVGKVLADISNPSTGRLEELKRLSGLKTDQSFQSQLDALVRGKSISALEQLKVDANTLYKNDRATQGESERLRLVLDRLSRALDELQPKSGGKATAAPTATQTQAQLLNQRLGTYASSRYDGRYLPDASRLSGLALTDLENFKRGADERLRAQQLRVDQAAATNGNVKAEVESLNLLKEQLRTLEQQLTIKRQLGNTAAKQNDPAYRQAQQEKAAQQAAERDSYAANRARVLSQINQNQIRRDVDGGADMFRNQAMLLRNYAVLGGGVAAGYSTGNFIVELDKNFAQLQAILALTYNDMEKVKGSLIEISELTKFDAVEVVDTAVILGQAGLSKDQILEALPGITLFATAVGTDLKSAVDLATSAMGVFNFEATRMPEIVDKLTISINQSKLNLDKVSLGLQYAGNIAEQSNVSFEDTVAALAAMANSGVKSGSTLGTGLRQILITLQKPTEGFKKKIFDLGLTMEDLDLRTYSLTDVMAKLSSSGFTVVDAMETMEVRAANAYGAFANNIQTARDITTAMNQSGAAAGANAVQMGALANQWARFTSIGKSVFYDALAPMIEVLTDLVRLTADLVSNLKGAGPLLNGLLAIGATRLAVGGVVGVGKLAGRVLGGGKSGIPGSDSGVGTAAAIATTAALSSTASTSAVLAVVRTVLGGPWIWGLSGVAALTAYAMSSNNRSARLQQPLDMAKFESNQIQARLDRYSAGTKSVDSIISDAYYKRGALEDAKTGPEMMRQFVGQLNSELKNLGFYMEETNPAFDTLIGKLEELRGRMIAFTEIDLARQSDAARNEAKAQFGLLAGYQGQSQSGQGIMGPQNRYTTSVVSTFNPELANFLGLKANNRQFNTGDSPFTKLLSAGKGLNLNSPREDIVALEKTLKGRLTDLILLTQEMDAKPELLKARANANYVKPESVMAELELAKKDIEGQIQIVDDILNQLQKSDRLPQQQQIVAIVEAVKRQFGARANTFVESVAERNGQISKQYGKDALGLYRGLTEYRGQSETEARGLNQEIKAFVQTELAKSKLPAELLNKVLTDSRYPEFINGALAKTRSAQSSAAPSALRSLKRQNRAEGGSVEAELELRELELSDANNLKDIERLEKAIAALLRKQSALQLEISKAEAGEDLTQLEQIQASSRDALDSRLGSNAENANRQRARLQAGSLFAKGDFRLSGVSRTYSKEIARAADQYFDKTNAEESARLKAQLAAAEKEKNRADELKRQADKLVGRADDAGLGSEGQKQAYLLSIPLIERASQTAVRSMQQEISAYQADNRVKQARVSELTAALPNMSVAEARRYQEEINKLTPTIEDNNKKIQELQGSIDKNTYETGQQTNAMRGNAAMAELRDKPFLSQDRRRVQAIVKGGSYQTDKQILAGEGEFTSAGTAAGGLGQQARNAFDYALTQSSKAYEGMDGLTEAALGLKSVLDGAGSSLGNFFTQFATGSMTAGESFRGFAASILQSLTDVAMQIAANALMQQLISFAISSFAPKMDLSMATGAQPLWNGGQVGAPKRYASGGLITSGMQTRDSTLVHAAQGEFVLRRAAVQALGVDTVRTLNNMDRGSVKSLEAMPSGERSESSGREAVVNVWVVSEDEKANSMDENSMLVVVNKALMRDSTTKKLVKRISTGDM